MCLCSYDFVTGDNEEFIFGATGLSKVQDSSNASVLFKKEVPGNVWFRVLYENGSSVQRIMSSPVLELKVPLASQSISWIEWHKDSPGNDDEFVNAHGYSTHTWLVGV